MLLGIIDQRRNGALTLLTETGIEIAALRADVLRRLDASTAACFRASRGRQRQRDEMPSRGRGQDRR